MIKIVVTKTDEGYPMHMVVPLGVFKHAEDAVLEAEEIQSAPIFVEYAAGVMEDAERRPTGADGK